MSLERASRRRRCAGSTTGGNMYLTWLTFRFCFKWFENGASRRLASVATCRRTRSEHVNRRDERFKKYSSARILDGAMLKNSDLPLAHTHLCDTEDPPGVWFWSVTRTNRLPCCRQTCVSKILRRWTMLLPRLYLRKKQKHTVWHKTRWRRYKTKKQ